MRSEAMSSAMSVPVPDATRAAAPSKAATACVSPASSSVLPCAVSMTRGPERPKRASGRNVRCSQPAASTEAPPNAAPVTTASVGMPARRTSNSIRSARASANSAAFAHAAARPGIDQEDDDRRTFVARALEESAKRRHDSRRCCRPGSARPAPWPAHVWRQPRSRAARSPSAAPGSVHRARCGLTPATGNGSRLPGSASAASRADGSRISRSPVT